MGHFSYYVYIPPGRGIRGRIICAARRLLRRLLWPVLLENEARYQRIYDSLQALRAEQRRLDGQACARLAIQRRLDFMERAVASLEAPSSADRTIRAGDSAPPRARCA
jgi:hypothetical protein